MQIVLFSYNALERNSRAERQMCIGGEYGNFRCIEIKVTV